MATTVLLISTSSSPWSRPSDWADAGHTVELVGCGGPGSIGFAGTGPRGSGGGGAGGYGLFTYSSGSLGSTTSFRCQAQNTSTASNNDFTTNATCWQSTSITNADYAACGGAAQGSAGSPANFVEGAAATTGAVHNGTPSPVTYTLTTHNEGAAGGASANSTPGGGGGGAGGPNGSGKAGGAMVAASPSGGTGGGGANGGSSTAGSSNSGATGGNGGAGNGGSGGGVGGGATGTAGTSGGGGGAGDGSSSSGVGSTGGAGGTLGNATNWTDNSGGANNGVTAGAGGGGGGSGANTVNAACTLTAGNGGNYGSGGGSCGGARNGGSTRTAGNGGGGLIVITYTPAVVGSRPSNVVTVQEQPRHSGVWLWPSVPPPPATVSPSIKTSFATVQEYPLDHPTGRSLFRPGVQGPNVAAHPQVEDSLVTIQEYPLLHPAFPFLRPGVQGPNVAAHPQVEDSLVTTQEQPLDHPSMRPFLRPGVHPRNVGAPSIENSLSTVQELPLDHPVGRSQFRPGVQGPNVAARPQVEDSLATVQEQPWHPGSFVGPNLIYIASKVLTPETRRAITIQEQPFHPLPSFRPGVQGPNVGAPSIENSLSTVQEQPIDHPAHRPFLRASVQGPNVAAPLEGRSAVTTQEQPDHPRPFVARPAPTAAVTAAFPVPLPLLTRPQEPDHPSTSFVRGSQQFVATAPTDSIQSATWRYGVHTETLIADGAGRAFVQISVPTVSAPPPRPVVRLTTVQEQPPEPSKTFTWQGVPGRNVAARPQVEDSLTTVQEYPLDHPSGRPFLRPGVQGPNVAAPLQGRAVTTTQEQPWHSAPFSWWLAKPVRPTPPTTSIAITSQEEVHHRHPGSQSKPGIFVNPAVTPTPPTRAQWTTTQEQPDHPAPALKSGPVGQKVGAPSIENSITTVQEQPGEPTKSIFRPGVQGPNVKPPVVDRLLTRQEQPDHPPSHARVGVQGPNVAAPPQIQNLFATTKQEQPYHPPAFIGPNLLYTPSLFLAPVRRQAITVQEQPDQPAPILRPGKQGPNVAPPAGIRALLTKAEEILGHPQPFFRSSIIVVPPVPPGRRDVLTTQEPTWHPGSFMLAGRPFGPPPGPQTAVRRQALTRQEQPREAPPWFWHGAEPRAETIIGEPPLLGSPPRPSNLLGSLFNPYLTAGAALNPTLKAEIDKST